MDQAAGRDRTFRTIFGGKVIPIDPQPESILYFYLTTPRVAAPRWFHEGGAVFIDTWMAGGVGRAQGGYDEMVFRAMVKDHTSFYDPLGLVSEGTKIDFQTEVNSYLYGTRFMTWLALPVLAGESRRVAGPQAGQQGVLREPVPARVRRRRSRTRGPTGSPSSTRSSRPTSTRSASTRSRPTATSRRARSARSPAPTSIRRRDDLRGVQLPGRRRARRRDLDRDGRDART